MSSIPLVLASTSVYRAELLGRVGLPFSTCKPEVDETPLADESPANLALRLAIAKATAGSEKNSGATVIGSDQVAELNGQPLGKPGTRTNAVAQLLACSGQTVRFHTGLAIIGADKRVQSCVVATDVEFRNLTNADCERYLKAEPAYDCAGSFKSEGLGISLTSAMRTDDATALVGLPLIKVCEFLRVEGYALP